MSQRIVFFTFFTAWFIIFKLFVAKFQNILFACWTYWIMFIIMQCIIQIFWRNSMRQQMFFELFFKNYSAFWAYSWSIWQKNLNTFPMISIFFPIIRKSIFWIIYKRRKFSIKFCYFISTLSRNRKWYW